VGDLVPEDDSQLVVVHVGHQAAEDVDGVVRHRHGVPLLVVDDVNAHRLRRDVRGQQAVDDAAGAIDLGPGRHEGADRFLLAVGRRVVDLLCLDVGLLGLVRSLEDLVLHERPAVGPRDDLARQDGAVGPAPPLDLHLVPERDGGDRLDLARALEAGLRVGADALRVDDERAGLAVFEVAVEADLLALRRRGGRGDGGEDGQRDGGEHGRGKRDGGGAGREASGHRRLHRQGPS
jgi:hypothetical protein